VVSEATQSCHRPTHTHCCDTAPASGSHNRVRWPRCGRHWYEKGFQLFAGCQMTAGSSASRSVSRGAGCFRMTKHSSMSAAACTICRYFVPHRIVRDGSVASASSAGRRQAAGQYPNVLQCTRPNAPTRWDNSSVTTVYTDGGGCCHASGMMPPKAPGVQL